MRSMIWFLIPLTCLTLPMAQCVPDMTLLQGVERLGIVGILSGAIFLLLMDRRQILSRSSARLEEMEKRLARLESSVTVKQEQMLQLLGEISRTLSEIRDGQERNFSHLWEWGIVGQPPEE